MFLTFTKKFKTIFKTGTLIIQTTTYLSCNSLWYNLLIPEMLVFNLHHLIQVVCVFTDEEIKLDSTLKPPKLFERGTSIGAASWCTALLRGETWLGYPLPTRSSELVVSQGVLWKLRTPSSSLVLMWLRRGTSIGVATWVRYSLSLPVNWLSKQDFPTSWPHIKRSV